MALAPSDTSGRPVVTCDMSAVSAPDLGTVDALCRLRMSVAPLGYVLRLREATTRLEELLSLCGLEGSFLVGEGQPEEGEEALGVEKEVEPGDAPF
jgi:anti-anti-sigma regulatory factor